MRPLNTRWAVVGATGLLLSSLTSLTAAPASAHGYADGPLSRSAACAQGLNKDCGTISYEPQSLEAPKGFPEKGPADGELASAGGLFGGTLDEQSPDRWHKTDVTTGPLRVSWKYTAPHLTSGWKYYITKQGWDGTAPLTRANLELIETVQHDGSKANTNPVHTVDIPANRSGYHVIYAVWDVADTTNAFYNAIDVMVKGGGGGTTDTEAPTAPSKVEAADIATTKVGLTWSAASDNVGVADYIVYRGGKQVGVSTTTSFTDTGLDASTEYSYTVAARDAAGNVSGTSTAVTVTTDAPPAGDTTAPSVPSGLHTMSVTESSVSLMWSASTDDNAVASYRIFRDGKQIGETAETMFDDDQGLVAGNAYGYEVRAVDAAGNESGASKLLEVTLKGGGTEVPGDDPAWDPRGSYAKGDVVVHNGARYEALQSYEGKGDPGWIAAPSLWKKLG